ncbi:Anp1p NDAI_0G00340 [Naumovozyma dairenensis CBS 421]|uniref:Mannan polymerase II complex ANP1 subunit n=1 Tax=Naumovozyma dairenensis (strain ATCC 10597 / BCRC 20456 / CBS 421 / NBRC 0211 / NRRL Y-12639) TaxID=1071378 RepID=G0WDE9_NAUDC|nr:hypothetical protein NDAI_0G00340 [Naumovozyma dairenensis CBS 421]CCD25810.2 hypothetical protein NDAI_0G00340 [Naumovozyma dairenensis CBS 421]
MEHIKRFKLKHTLISPTTISIAGTLLTLYFLSKFLFSISPSIANIITFPITLISIIFSPSSSTISESSSTSIFLNPYVPNFRNNPGVEFYDLANYQGNKDGWQKNDRILFCVPLRDAAEHLPMFFDHLNKMSYPHNSIDLSFLVSDSSDDTMGVLLSNLQNAQSQQDKSKRFGNIEIFEKDFGQVIGQSFSDRHGFAAQGPRRKLMARARNWLGSVAIKPYHSWVYWRDVDVETIPRTIMEDLMHHDKDVIVPNVWRPLPDWLGNIQPYDLNSWKESEGGLQLADTLGEDDVIVEGYPEYATWRSHLAYMRDPNGNPEDEMELDGIGGVSILAKAKVFRTGSHFPAFSFEKHAETEAFGKLSRKMNYNVIGLPHYVIWHIYEPSKEDLKHMAWMAEEEKRKLEEEKLEEFYDKIWEIGFDDVREDWETERDSILKNIDFKGSENDIFVDWSDDPENENNDKANKANSNQNAKNGQGNGEGASGDNPGQAQYPKEVPLEFDPDKN